MQQTESETDVIKSPIYGTVFENVLIRDMRVLEQSDWLLLSFDRTAELEGFSAVPYEDGNNLAVGYGVNIKAVSHHEALYLAWARYIDMYHRVSAKINCFELLPIHWKSVIMDIQYNTGDVAEFKNFLEAVCARDLTTAIAELRDSKLYRQLPERTELNIQHLERAYR